MDKADFELNIGSYFTPRHIIHLANQAFPDVADSDCPTLLLCIVYPVVLEMEGEPHFVDKCGYKLGMFAVFGQVCKH